MEKDSKNQFTDIKQEKTIQIAVDDNKEIQISKKSQNSNSSYTQAVKIGKNSKGSKIQITIDDDDD